MKFLNLAVLAATTAMAAPPMGPQKERAKRALYFLESNPKGAAIISLPIGEDGRLQSRNATGAVRTSMGGKGAIGVGMNGTNMADSVVVRGNHLFTVNAGSSTLSRFYIPQNDPLHPQLVGKPMSTVGEFPSTVAYSEKNQLACVANTGRRAGVQCFRVPDCDQLEPVGDFMPLPLNQMSPPMGPPNTVGDIVFNPSESALFVTVKGDGMGKGHIFAYRVKDGTVNSKPVISRPKELRLDFSLTFLSDSAAVISRPKELRLDFSLTFLSDSAAVITDPAYGASRLSIASNFSVSVINRVAIPGQKVSCWSVYSPEFKAVYILDGMTPDVTALKPETGDVKYVIPGEKRGMGAFDAIADRSSLYVLQGSAAIAVFDLKGSGGEAKPRVSQYLDPSALGERAPWIGMAVYSD